MLPVENRGWRYLPDFSRALYRDTYFLPNENYDEWMLRILAPHANDAEHLARLTSYVKNLWMHPSTPISTGRGLPIACYVSHVGDSNESIFDSYNEGAWLGALGGGRGVYWGDVGGAGRPIGLPRVDIDNMTWTEIQEKDIIAKSPGVIPFLGVSDRATYAISQAGTRRSTEAAYIPIGHADIIAFKDIRLETGDNNRRMPNLHHGIAISDNFLEAVERLDKWELRDPHTNQVTDVVDAFDLFMDILLIRKTESGEPFLLFIDTVNADNPPEYSGEGYLVYSSNICCLAGDTEVVTLEGIQEIRNLVGKTVTIFDGDNWVKCSNFREYPADSVIRIHLKNGVHIDSNKDHRWFAANSYNDIRNNRYTETTTENLEEGMWLEERSHIETHGTKELQGAYAKGFLLGDGTLGNGLPVLNVHFTKYTCMQTLLNSINEEGITNDKCIADVSFSDEVVNPSQLGRQQFRRIKGLSARSGFAPFCSEYKQQLPDFTDLTEESKLLLLSGILDADGTYSTAGLQLSSIHGEFVNSIQRLLFTLGVTCSTAISYRRPGDLSIKPLYRLTIGNYDSYKLFGRLSCKRLESPEIEPNRRTTGYRQIVKIEALEGKQPVYCPQIPTTKKFLLANGIMTGNTEIVGATAPDMTAVCCLASFNLEQWDEYEDQIDLVVADTSDMLSNVLINTIREIESFSPLKKAAFKRVVKFIIDTMEIGMGVMGFHSLLQSKMIPFESPMAKGLNIKIIKKIKEASDKHQASLPKEQACRLGKEYGSFRRNLHSLAIAPTMSISTLSGLCSSGVEPWVANIFVKKVPTGSFTIRNKYLAKLLKEEADRCKLSADWIDEQWKDINKASGSVLNLEWMPDFTKDVFKTAFEIDQRYVITHAADRQEIMVGEQSQSINLFMGAEITYEELYQIHMMAWKMKLKSLYYLRSEPAQQAETSGRERQPITLEDDACVLCT